MENIPSSEAVSPKCHVHFPFPRPFQKIRPIPRPCVTFHNVPVFTVNIRSPSPIPKLEDYPLSVVSCPPYLEAISSIRNSKTRHAMMTGTHLTWLFLYLTPKYSHKDFVLKYPYSVFLP